MGQDPGRATLGWDAAVFAATEEPLDGPCRYAREGIPIMPERLKAAALPPPA